MLIREEDEDYWDERGATPKAFVSEATGRKLWSTRFGSTRSRP
jgi:putative ABC transport system permease protein